MNARQFPSFCTLSGASHAPRRHATDEMSRRHGKATVRRVPSTPKRCLMVILLSSFHLFSVMRWHDIYGRNYFVSCTVPRHIVLCVPPSHSHSPFYSSARDHSARENPSILHKLGIIYIGSAPLVSPGRFMYSNMPTNPDKERDTHLMCPHRARLPSDDNLRAIAVLGNQWSGKWSGADDDYILLELNRASAEIYI